MKKILLYTVMTLMLSVPMAAHAFVIDFEGFSAGDVVSGAGVFSDVEFSKGGLDIEIWGAAPGLPLTGNTALTFPFDGPDAFRADFSLSGINMVSIDIGDWDADWDNIWLEAYSSDGSLLDSDAGYLPMDLYGGLTLSVSAFDISYVLWGSVSGGTFDNTNSVAFDNFTYTSAVPEVTSVFLLGLGLLGLGAYRRNA